MNCHGPPFLIRQKDTCNKITRANHKNSVRHNCTPSEGRSHAPVLKPLTLAWLRKYKEYLWGVDTGTVVGISPDVCYYLPSNQEKKLITHTQCQEELIVSLDLGLQACLVVTEKTLTLSKKHDTNVFNVPLLILTTISVSSIHFEPPIPLWTHHRSGSLGVEE